MSSAPAKSLTTWSVALLARLILGGLFIYMGLNKALHPVEFLKLVRQYDLTHAPLILNSIAAGLPWFEVFCGLLLIAGVAVRGAALMLLAMLVPFTIVVLNRAMGLHETSGLPFCLIKFDCGCGAGEEFICRKVAENTLLMLVSLFLVCWREHAFALRASLFR